MSKNRTLVFALLVTFSAQVAAIDRLSLEVVCELAEHRYQQTLTSDEIKQVESSCASEVAELLGERISFFEFVAGVERDNKLEIRIGKNKQEADSSAFRPVNFEIEVSGINVMEQGEPVIWNFRSVAEFLDLPSATTFADAIAVRFTERLENNEEQLVRGQLGRLLIAGSAFPMPAEQSWLLPFSREELGIADNSEFKIKAALVFPSSEEHFTYNVVLFGDFASATGVPSDFHNKVKALHLGDDKLAQEASIKRLTTADDVRVEYVLISHYVQMSEPDHTSPGNLTLTVAGDGQ